MKVNSRKCQLRLKQKALSGLGEGPELFEEEQKYRMLNRRKLPKIEQNLLRLRQGLAMQGAKRNKTGLIISYQISDVSVCYISISLIHSIV
jgi:hypothetical protein